MKLYAFMPDQTGYEIYYVMSSSLECAKQAVRDYDKKHNQGWNLNYTVRPEDYRIEVYLEDEVCHDVAD